MIEGDYTFLSEFQPYLHSVTKALKEKLKSPNGYADEDDMGSNSNLRRLPALKAEYLIRCWGLPFLRH